MEGFGVHTFRMINAEGESSLVKLHWRPKLGTHALVWEEAQLAGGTDPDFHRRDLADAIDAGAYPQWDLAIQVMPDTPEETFEGIDLLDPTKFVPEELAPLHVIGTMTLHQNPTNFFAQTEQVAFHPGHLVAGIDVTNDPLLQGRLFSYLDTQLSRLGGPNFAQLPINRPHSDVNDQLRDGMHQTAVHRGVAPYTPNSLDGGCPFLAGVREGAFIDIPKEIAETVTQRSQPASFDDHFSQARMFFRSLTDIEQGHIIGAYTFELGKCSERAVKERQLVALANIDAVLCANVANALGLPTPSATIDVRDLPMSPSLRMVGQRWPADGRAVGILVHHDVDHTQLETALIALRGEGIQPLVIAPRGGMIENIPIHRSADTIASPECDALIAFSASSVPKLVRVFEEAFRHGKPIGAVSGAPAEMLAEIGIGPAAEGVVLGSPVAVVEEIVELLAEHRVWDRLR